MPRVLKWEGGLGGAQDKRGGGAQVKNCSGSAQESDGRGCSVVEEHGKESCPLVGEDTENSHREIERASRIFIYFELETSLNGVELLTTRTNPLWLFIKFFFLSLYFPRAILCLFF